VGSHVARNLADLGWEVHAVVRPSTAASGFAGVRHVHDGSTERMTAIVGESRPDVVFHLASLFITEHRPEQVAPLIESNLLLGTQLAEAMRAHGCARLVNTGTAWQHYHGEDYHPINLYAATKQAYLDVLRYYQEAAGLRVVTLELYESYGPGDPRPKLMSALIKAARQGGTLALTDGSQRLDLVHVKDIARAFQRAGERLLANEAEPDERWAVRTGQPRTVREIAALVSRAAGMPLEAEWGARKYRARELMEPPERPTLPGWSAEVPLDSGIRELLGDLYGGS
jgi:nucleoside-diphosphate-sugar epimerase